ncbi:hypothetical protein [Youngiibacter fragilis]|uniref:Uncharacterized protein n=1 Tax=Youngiibacter fragilis 232.1 TaxID=994573 RepID=V7IA28_9CLOT|nr:hypothetical protein [Youngiibacter fragilis]ETA82199.1 hypothetical protein T472_0202350 [Youngiibacter fragilis 232.1]
MEQLIGELVVPARSGHNFRKGEELKLIEVAGACITFQRADGAELVIDARNKALIEINEDSISIYEPICREMTIKESRLLKKADKLFGQLKKRPDYGDLRSFWEIEGFLQENNAGYLSGFNIEEDRVLQDGMICDFSIRGELKISFNRQNCEAKSLKDKESRSAIAASYRVAKYAIETWLDIAARNEADLNRSLE